ncbi:unnamed protein product [Protopolystoma xenopodis]|uniref:Uncharacterized protein n=1 Tax=Protopolystoma xenopodis TaxID=117903 RepID=A0A3S5A5P1_9PLAT|nr:unnamed protein product [Protopolystoma xenopodis]
MVSFKQIRSNEILVRVAADASDTRCSLPQADCSHPNAPINANLTPSFAPYSTSSQTSYLQCSGTTTHPTNSTNQTCHFSPPRCAVGTVGGIWQQTNNQPILSNDISSPCVTSDNTSTFGATGSLDSKDIESLCSPISLQTSSAVSTSTIQLVNQSVSGQLQSEVSIGNNGASPAQHQAPESSRWASLAISQPNVGSPAPGSAVGSYVARNSTVGVLDVKSEPAIAFACLWAFEISVCVFRELTTNDILPFTSSW